MSKRSNHDGRAEHRERKYELKVEKPMGKMKEEQQKRWLMFHDESDCLFEVYTEEEVRKAIENDGCVDVTDEPKAEARFKNEEA